MECVYCGERVAVKEVGEGFFRCHVCGRYFRFGKPYNLIALSGSSVAERSASNLPIRFEVSEESSESLSKEMSIFVERVVDKLTSHPKHPEWKAPEHIREKVRKELTDVLMDKKSFSD